MSLNVSLASSPMLSATWASAVQQGVWASSRIQRRKGFRDSSPRLQAVTAWPCAHGIDQLLSLVACNACHGGVLRRRARRAGLALGELGPWPPRFCRGADDVPMKLRLRALC
ncbi:hypothetical protein BU23DRAFT_2281 [Bimuria novae-zelandiae CBS 107.79]|uniref:Uncharacterized protein n=1 Tax=Bimuria novae-zelandiae CBS 107.79 TaxID=1447943 RepID=A0A6A5VQX2_9PLEO|nr:hypothetical protein BU23DRAFT_2281 [Bimuria novae-zelandiae CBS 107.79]